MTTTAENPTTLGTESLDPWRGFVGSAWRTGIDVRDFVQRNYTPFAGDAGFLAGPTDKTLRVWDTLQRDYLSVERVRRVFDVDTRTPADVDAFAAGYISDDDDVLTDDDGRYRFVTIRPGAYPWLNGGSIGWPVSFEMTFAAR